jgi:hypothetical protein
MREAIVAISAARPCFSGTISVSALAGESSASMMRAIRRRLSA